jgi:hypothetical protein
MLKSRLDEFLETTTQARRDYKIVGLAQNKERVYGETNIQRWKHGWLLLQMVVFAALKLKFV